MHLKPRLIDISADASRPVVPTPRTCPNAWQFNFYEGRSFGQQPTVNFVAVLCATTI